MKSVMVVLCGVVALALSAGAQPWMPGHSVRPGDGAPDVAARLQPSIRAAIVSAHTLEHHQEEKKA